MKISEYVNAIVPSNGRPALQYANGIEYTRAPHTHKQTTTQYTNTRIIYLYLYLYYNRHWGSFLSVKRPGSGVEHRRPTSAVV